MIHRYISLPEIAAGNMSGLEPGERDEALRRFAQGTLNLVKRTAPTTTPADEPTKPSGLLSPARAAEYLDVKESWVMSAARSGKLPCVMVGRYVRFRAADLDALVAPDRALR